MEQFLIEVAKQVPSLGVLVLLVRWFLIHMRDSTKVMSGLHEELGRHRELYTQILKALPERNTRAK